MKIYPDPMNSLQNSTDGRYSDSDFEQGEYCQFWLNYCSLYIPPIRRKRRFLLKNGMVIKECFAPIQYIGNIFKPFYIRGLSSIFKITEWRERWSNGRCDIDEPYLLIRRLVKAEYPDFPYYGAYGKEYEVVEEVDDYYPFKSLACCQL